MSAPIPRRRFLATGLASLALPWLAACLERTGMGLQVEPRLTARPGTPAGEAPTGLSALGLETGRDGILYVPESYAPDMPMPLFVALHGAGGRATDWAAYYDLCEARGLILLAVDARGSTWDRAQGGFGPDVWFIDAALEWTFQRCAVDPARIALAGFSDGASYALSLGVSNGDLLTHLVAYSPGFYWPEEPIVGRPRVFVSHGTQDPVLSVSTSRDGIVPTLRTAGYDVTYREFGGGHEVPRSISDEALDWLTA